jgi:hypothetical protein
VTEPIGRRWRCLKNSGGLKGKVGVGGTVVGWGVRTPDAEHTTPPDSSLSTVFFYFISFYFKRKENISFGFSFSSPRRRRRRSSRQNDVVKLVPKIERPENRSEIIFGHQPPIPQSTPACHVKKRYTLQQQQNWTYN